RVWPHVEYTWNKVAPPIGRGFMFVWRPVWRVLKVVGRFIWRAVAGIGRLIALLGGLVWRIVPDGFKRWLDRRVQHVIEEESEEHPTDTNRQRSGDFPRNKHLDRLLSGNTIVIAFYVSIFLELNEM